MAEAPVPMWTYEWWIAGISFVAGGLILNLAAAYLKPWIDRVGGRMSKAWATRSEKLARERLARIEALRQNETIRQATILRVLHREAITTKFLVLSVLFAFFTFTTGSQLAVMPAPSNLAYTVGAFLMFVIFLAGAGYNNFDTARIWDELQEALTSKADDPQP